MNLPDKLRVILECCRREGVDTISVSFDGSGDDGQINDALLNPPVAPEVCVDWVTKRLEFDASMRAWTTAFIPQSVTLLEAIDDYVSDLLEVTNVDWYNNDGGFGELHISVQNGTYSFDVSTRYTESTCVHAVQCSVDEVLT